MYREDRHAEFGTCADDCYHWKFGAWGEDVFAQRCIDHHFVDKVEAFDVATDGACIWRSAVQRSARAPTTATIGKLGAWGRGRLGP